MKAITLDVLGTPPALRDDLPEPAPGAGELLVRVQASSVNPVDNAIAAGMLSEMRVEHELPVTLGEEGVEVPIQETYGLARAPEALAALGTTHTRGKLAIRVAWLGLAATS